MAKSSTKPAGDIGDDGLRGDHRRLEAAIKLHVGESCPLHLLGSDAEIVDLNPRADECAIEFSTQRIGDVCESIEREGGECCGEDIPRSAESEIVRATTPRQVDCLCRVFEEHGCTPRIQGRDNSFMLVETFLEDRQEFTALVEDLQNHSDYVQVVRLQRTKTKSKQCNQVGVDLNALTAKQRECLETALEYGFFDSPRGITQSELAEKLGISPSAVSRRLRAIQKQLFKQISSGLEF